MNDKVDMIYDIKEVLKFREGNGISLNNNKFYPFSDIAHLFIYLFIYTSCIPLHIISREVQLCLPSKIIIN